MRDELLPELLCDTAVSSSIDQHVTGGWEMGLRLARQHVQSAPHEEARHKKDRKVEHVPHRGDRSMPSQPL